MKIGILKEYNPNQIYDPGSFDKPIYYIGDNLDLEFYNDITSIKNLFDFLSYDFRKKVYIARNYMNEIGFENLSDDDKKLACKYRLIEDIEVQILYFTEQEIIQNLKEFNKESKDVRIARWEAAAAFLTMYLPDLNAIDMTFEMDGLNLNKNFIDYSIGSKAENGMVSGIFDYIEGTYDFIDSGFPVKAYWTQELQDNIINILKNGIY